jgi:hypothetical protein
MNFDFVKQPPSSSSTHNSSQLQELVTDLKKNVKITTNMGTKTPAAAAESLPFDSVVNQREPPPHHRKHQRKYSSSEEEEEEERPIILEEVKLKHKKRKSGTTKTTAATSISYFKYFYFLVLFAGSVGVSYFVYEARNTPAVIMYPLVDTEAIANNPIFFNFSMFTPFHASAHLQILEYNFKQHLQKGSHLICLCMHHLKTEYHTSYRICAVESVGQMHLLVNPRLIGKTETSLFVEWDDSYEPHDVVFARFSGRYAACLQRVIGELE